MQIVSRTYAPVVAGVLQQLEYSHSTKHFTLVYYQTKACTTHITEVRSSYIRLQVD